MTTTPHGHLLDVRGRADASLATQHGTVQAVHRSARHTISKMAEWSIRLVEGHGVEGDAHAGATTKHRYQVRKDPTRPNLRQVHLIQGELFDELAGHGFDVTPGLLGENVTTRGLDLLALPAGTCLHLGAEAIVELTGLRTPCKLIDQLRPGLMGELLGRDTGGRVVRRAGVMSVVRVGGEVHVDDPITAVFPPLPHLPLVPV